MTEIFKKWLIALTQEERVIVNGPFVGKDEQAVDSAVDGFIEKKLGHDILVNGELWTLSLRAFDDINQATMDHIPTMELRLSDPQVMHQLFSKAKIYQAEMIVQDEKWIYLHTSDDEFQLFRDGNVPTFYVVPGSAADTPEDTWGTSPGYSEASGVWD